ncbi:AAA family ATPase [Rhizobium mesoamericanum]|uniref:AAA family ATPase n=1 Tax=Rhizobium mesoamericanum TaxID=1079800 RepID=UPI00040B459E|nr:AAA family ATPase [Rhizobium mesoamericanum]
MSIAKAVFDAVGGKRFADMDTSGNKVCIPGPGHGKDDRSLSVMNDASNPDGFVVNSFAGDDAAQCRDHVRRLAGLPEWKPTPRADRPTDPQFVYRDEHGQPYLRVTKVHKPTGKAFYQHSWNGMEWVRGAQQVRIPYRLPEVVVAQDVFICEGEKDCDRLADLGLVATTAPEGAGKWRPELSKWFAGKRVIILADNDQPGRDHASQVEEALRAIAASVRSVHFPTLAEKGDVSDFLDMGNGKAELLEYCEKHQGNIPHENVSEPKRLSARELMKMHFPPKREIIKGIIPAGCIILVGAPKVGKSWFVLQAATAVASGSDFLGAPTEQGDVLYLALEDGFARLQSRLMMQAQGCIDDIPDGFDLQTEIPLADKGGLGAIEEWLQQHPKASMVIVDVLKMFRATRSAKTNPYDQDYADIRPLTELANRYKVAIVIVHHTNKGSANAIDPFDRVSGTGGISGAADGTLILAPDEAGTIGLYGRGRDFMEFDKAIQLQPETCTWTVDADAPVRDMNMGDTANMILRTLRDTDEPMSPTLISAATDIDRVTVSQKLAALEKKGTVRKVGRGQWELADKSKVVATSTIATIATLVRNAHAANSPSIPSTTIPTNASLDEGEIGESSESSDSSDGATIGDLGNMYARMKAGEA